MPLRTVRVPEGVEGIFARAEEVVSRFFSERTDDPTRGTIEIYGERYVLVRAASLSVEFFDLVRDLYGPSREGESQEFARNILFDLAHAVGKSDAKNFHTRMGLVDPIARMSAGPVHFSHAGWAFVDIADASRPVPGPDFYLLYDHPYSFESAAWGSAGRKATFPVCIMNAGYSSGWCEESFNLTLVASEVLCRARGDEVCRFIMAPPDKLEAHVESYLDVRAASGVSRASYSVPDFFARKRMEEDLRQRFAEEMREREAAEAKLRQAHKLEAIGRLAGGIAHDFNNLMAIVIARASLLARKLPEGDRMRDELITITEAGERASALTKQLLAFSSAQVLKRDRISFDEAVRELTTLLAPILGEDVELDFTFGAPTSVVLGDRSQLEQVVTNLLVNARDAMPTGGRLCVRTDVILKVDAPRDVDAAARYVRLVVEDTGIGMDETTVARIFDPYFSTKLGQGTGLGLATVYGIVRQSGGHISVTSTVGIGTSFTVVLPECEGDAEVRPRAPRTERPRSRRRARLLLVEDHPEVRAALELTLADGEYDVTVADGPDAALALPDVLLAEIDVLVTDIVMPRMNGQALARALRERNPALHVLFVSGYSPDLALLESLPSARFLAKPFRPSELVHALSALREDED